MFTSFFQTSWGGTAFIEISIMLLWAFVLWFVLSNTISNYKKKKYIKKSKLDKIKSSYSQSKKYWLYEEKTEVDTSYYNQNNGVKKNIIDDNLLDDNIIVNKEESDSVNVDTKKEVSFIDNFLDILSLEEKWDTSLRKEESEEVSKKDFTENESFEIKKLQEQENETFLDSDFHIIKDAGEKWFTVKDTFKKDESIMNIHKKNIKDNLTKIEGIWPKIEVLLNDEWIYTYAELASTDVYQISNMLTNAWTRYQMHNPKTWPKQAELAKNGNLKELIEYQKKLKWWKE